MGGVAIAGEEMVTEIVQPEEHYTSSGRIQNKISHEKERLIELSTSMALGRVQGVVKQAFRRLRNEIIPLYMTVDIEHRDAWTVWKRNTVDADARYV